MKVTKISEVRNTLLSILTSEKECEIEQVDDFIADLKTNNVFSENEYYNSFKQAITEMLSQPKEVRDYFVKELQSGFDEIKKNEEWQNTAQK